jgi:hypothetical protein
MGSKNGTDPLRTMPVVAGTFYVATGIWPILHHRSFERVTGPKVDRWLVKTTGALLTAIGVSLIAGRRDGSRLAPVLGIGSAVALAAADVVYVAKGRISPVYLVDAVAEIGLVIGWAAELHRRDLDSDVGPRW